MSVRFQRPCLGIRKTILAVNLPTRLGLMKDVYLCFLDYDKSFDDKVRHDDLIEILENTQVSSRGTRIIIKKMYTGNKQQR